MFCVFTYSQEQEKSAGQYVPSHSQIVGYKPWRNVFQVHCLLSHLSDTSQPVHYSDFSPFNIHSLKLMSY